ncbi:MAG: hypothetical protein WBQ21_13520 [Solirubrobacteraceae bacterium]
MTKRLIQNQDSVQALLVAVEVIAAAIVVDAWTSGKLWRLILGLPLLAAALLAHYALFSAAHRYRAKAGEHAIDTLLEVAARSLVYPLSWDEVEIRAFCYRLNSKKRCLEYVGSSSSHEYDDRWGRDVPLDAFDADNRPIFVIAEAAAAGMTVLRELPAKRSRVEEQVRVWPDIGCVLATAIHDPQASNEDRAASLGTVSFDISLEHRHLLIDNEKHAHDIICLVAQAVGALWS